MAPDIDYLDQQQHTVFGEVAEGFEVLDKFNEAFVDKDGLPYQDIRYGRTRLQYSALARSASWSLYKISGPKLSIITQYV